MTINTLLSRGKEKISPTELQFNRPERAHEARSLPSSSSSSSASSRLLGSSYAASSASAKASTSSSSASLFNSRRTTHTSAAAPVSSSNPSDPPTSRPGWAADDDMRFVCFSFDCCESSQSNFCLLMFMCHISRVCLCAEQISKFYVGQWLDVKDTVNQWLEATVMEV